MGCFALPSEPNLSHRYVAMGPYPGGQAVSKIYLTLGLCCISWVVQEYLRVPFADFNALKLPPGKEHEADFALLADIFPTVSNSCVLPRSPIFGISLFGEQGWHGVQISVGPHY